LSLKSLPTTKPPAELTGRDAHLSKDALPLLYILMGMKLPVGETLHFKIDWNEAAEWLENHPYALAVKLEKDGHVTIGWIKSSS